MTDYQNALIQIIKALLNGQPVEKQNISAQMRAFAASHSLEHILGYAASEPSMQMITARHVIKQDAQLKAAAEILENCEKNGIYVMPLKGVCTVNRYPDPVLRSMGDIDLLYKAEQDKQLQAMMQALGYEWHGENQKHDHYTKMPYVGVEMHREMVPLDYGYTVYYETIWEKAVIKAGCQYMHELPQEDELIFFMVHSAIHFKMGGIGIRLLMDLYVYNHLGMDFSYVQAELEKLHLLDFYRKLTALSEMWFGNTDTDDTTILKLENYILSSGLYGTGESISAVSVADGKGAFIFKMAFPNLERMRTGYLFLEKYPWLLPYAWVKRGFNVLTKKRSTLNSQLKIAKRGDQELGKQIKAFWKECGLE